jgi:hypothetical protein
LTRYDHEVDRIIVEELKGKSRTCTQLYELFKSYGIRKIGYATVWEHLERLCEPEIGLVNKNDDPGPNNERAYSLSGAAEFQVEYDIFGVESKREDPAKHCYQTFLLLKHTILHFPSKGQF